jgi:hypothetical protein
MAEKKKMSVAEILAAARANLAYARAALAERALLNGSDPKARDEARPDDTLIEEARAAAAMAPAEAQLHFNLGLLLRRVAFQRDAGVQRQQRGVLALGGLDGQAAHDRRVNGRGAFPALGAQGFAHCYQLICRCVEHGAHRHDGAGFLGLGLGSAHLIGRKQRHGAGRVRRIQFVQRGLLWCGRRRFGRRQRGR